MSVRKIVKKIVTFICHPVITTYLFLHGTRNFYIAPFMKINDYRDLEIGSDFYLGKNSRFLLVYDMGGDCPKTRT